ncbi:MAG: type II toxin-antitoxin system Phd/YefM family antitoxin [Patescibacteria group bacterium]|nr:type II toxin-antitoxin system Phd/YefM family antitoxin [Patescibacteria group bacterium]
MVHTIPITKARIKLGEIAKRAHLKGEYFILEKDGIPVAGIMSADELEDYLESQDPKVNQIIKEGYKEYLAGKTRHARNLLDELRSDVNKYKKSKKNNNVQRKNS